MYLNILQYIIIAIIVSNSNLSFAQNFDIAPKFQQQTFQTKSPIQSLQGMHHQPTTTLPRTASDVVHGVKYNLTREREKILLNRLYQGTNSSGGGTEIEVMYRTRAIQIFEYLLSLDENIRKELAFSSWELLTMINNNDIYFSCAGKEEQEILQALNKRAYVFEESNNIIWLDCQKYDVQSWKEFLAPKKYLKNSTKRDFLSEINDSITIIHEVLRASGNKHENNYKLSSTYSKSIEKTLAFLLADYADDIIVITENNALFLGPQFKYIDQQVKLGSMQNSKKYEYANKFCRHVGFDFAEQKSIIFNYNPSDLNYLEFDEVGSLRGVKIGRPGWLYQYQQINCMKN